VKPEFQGDWRIWALKKNVRGMITKEIMDDLRFEADEELPIEIIPIDYAGTESAYAVVDKNGSSLFEYSCPPTIAAFMEIFKELKAKEKVSSSLIANFAQEHGLLLSPTGVIILKT
jgi:hypothetical protein